MGYVEDTKATVEEFIGLPDLRWGKVEKNESGVVKIPLMHKDAFLVYLVFRYSKWHLMDQNESMVNSDEIDIIINTRGNQKLITDDIKKAYPDWLVIPIVGRLAASGHRVHKIAINTGDHWFVLGPNESIEKVVILETKGLIHSLMAQWGKSDEAIPFTTIEDMLTQMSLMILRR